MENLNEDGSQALVTPFKALIGNASKKRALEGLVKALTHHQIRELRSAVEAVDKRCDFIAKLPAEINHIVLHYLPLHQVIQAQRVSKKWKQFLSSPQTVGPLLRGWFPERDIELGLQIPENLSREGLCSLKAEHIEAYRTGHAFSFVKYTTTSDDISGLSNPKAYDDGIIAMIVGRYSDTVRALDLRSGRNWSFVPEARIVIDAVAVSAFMVAVLLSGTCYVWTFSTERSYCFRLQSTRWDARALAVSGQSLAISCYRPGEVSGFEVVTWTLKDQRTSSFFVVDPIQGSRHSATLDEKGETLFLFNRTDPHLSGKAHFQFSRTNLAGDILAQGVIEVPRFESYRDHSVKATISKEVVNGRTAIWLFTKPRYVWYDNLGLMLIYYNSQEDRLEVRTQVIRGLRMDIKLMTNLFCWKDTTYSVHRDDESPELRVIDMQDSTWRKAKMQGSFNSIRPIIVSEGAYLFGDETFLIFVCDEKICAWCFDENVQIFKDHRHHRRVLVRKERRLDSK